MLCANAQGDAVLAGWDYLFLGYRTRQIVSYLDIARLIATQWENAAKKSPPKTIHPQVLTIARASILED
jgi:hypothetical protein